MRVKVKTYSGAVIEQEIFSVSDRIEKKENAPKKLRFRSEEERAKHRLDMSRRHFVRIINENFSPSSYYITLTLSDRYEVHTFDEAARIAERYVRRLKYAYPGARIVWVRGRGEHTNRIHYHFIVDGIPPEVIQDKWICGTVKSCSRLREHNYYDKVDHGRDYTGLANYLFDHWTPEQGSHRWRQTKNLKKPQREKPTEVKRNYSAERPPLAPKGYKLVEVKTTGYGYQYYKYVLDVNQTGFDEEINGQQTFRQWKVRRKAE